MGVPAFFILYTLRCDVCGNINLSLVPSLFIWRKSSDLCPIMASGLQPGWLEKPYLYLTILYT